MASVTPPGFLTSAGAAAAVQQQHPLSSLEDGDPAWKTQFQLLVTEGTSSQLVAALHLLPKLYRVRIPNFKSFYQGKRGQKNKTKQAT